MHAWITRVAPAGRTLALGGIALALMSCSTTQEIKPLTAIPSAAMRDAKSVVVFVVDRDDIRVTVHGAINWWSTTVGQGLIFFPLVGPIRQPTDAGYAAEVCKLRDPSAVQRRQYYVQMLKDHLHFPSATAVVFKVVSPKELQQGLFPTQLPAELYVDCTPRYSLGGSYRDAWSPSPAVLSVSTGPIVIPAAAAARAGPELGRMYEESPTHSTASALWGPGKFPFEGCYREYLTVSSRPYPKSDWPAKDGRLLQQESLPLLERLAREIDNTLNGRAGALAY